MEKRFKRGDIVQCGDYIIKVISRTNRHGRFHGRILKEGEDMVYSEDDFYILYDLYASKCCYTIDPDFILCNHQIDLYVNIDDALTRLEQAYEKDI